MPPASKLAPPILAQSVWVARSASFAPGKTRVGVDAFTASPAYVKNTISDFLSFDRLNTAEPAAPGAMDALSSSPSEKKPSPVIVTSVCVPLAGITFKVFRPCPRIAFFFSIESIFTVVPASIVVPPVQPTAPLSVTEPPPQNFIPPPGEEGSSFMAGATVKSNPLASIVPPLEPTFTAMFAWMIGYVLETRFLSVPPLNTTV